MDEVDLDFGLLDANAAAPTPSAISSAAVPHEVAVEPPRLGAGGGEGDAATPTGASGVGGATAGADGGDDIVEEPASTRP